MAQPGDLAGKVQWQRVGKRTAKFAVCPHLLCAVPSVAGTEQLICSCQTDPHGDQAVWKSL